MEDHLSSKTISCSGLFREIMCDLVVLRPEYSANLFHNMVADASAPCITRSSTTMVKTMQDKQSLFSTWKYFSYLNLLNVEK